MELSRPITVRIPIVALVLVAWLAGGCGGGGSTASTVNSGPGQKVLAVEPFLADIAQNVAGDRMQIGLLLPAGVDPHAFEPTPQDVARIADAKLLITNGSGLETWLDKVLSNAGGQRTVLAASAGLASRAIDSAGASPGVVDPHFWLDPTKVITYVTNIRDGLVQLDPANRDVYTANAAAYVAKLQDLDRSIAAQIQQIPPARRLLVTNHESLGYYADRYGLRIAGSVIPSLSSDAAPSAQELARLADTIRSSGAPAIFLETGVSPQLADQLAQETGVKVVTDLYTETISNPDGPAPTYLEMLRYDTKRIVDALR